MKQRNGYHRTAAVSKTSRSVDESTTNLKSRLARLLRALRLVFDTAAVRFRFLRSASLFNSFNLSFLLFLSTTTAFAADDQHPWSLKPIQRPTPPPIADKRWARNPIDDFIYQKLTESKLSPSPEAPRRILIRRLYFDLVGLPPTPEEVRAFKNDHSPDAYEKLVDRLLASPRYGERWAQHWLDVVRFAESHGFEMNQPRPNAWRYRDYVIQALNEDKPYDRFILEQVAGDALGEDAATGFLVAGPWDQVKSPDPVLTAAQRADELHDMVGVTGTAFLGMTVGCARCHNHKFDPIPQVDYYAMKACLAGVQHGERKLRTPDTATREREAEACQKQLATIEEKLTELEPLASVGRVLLFQPEVAFGSKTIKLLKPALHVNYPAGSARGERDFAGDVDHLPSTSRSYLAWSNAANSDVFVCSPAVEGRFRIRLSWGSRSDSHARDARFLLDRDGDLTTTHDQVEIARVDQRRFADGTSIGDKEKLWSGFYEAGAWDLCASTKIVLRGGETDGVVSAGIIALTEEISDKQVTVASAQKRGSGFENGLLSPALSSKGGEGDKTELRGSVADQNALDPGKVSSTSADTPSEVSPSPPLEQRVGERRPFLRAPVNARRNVDRFAAVTARFLRFTITRTTDAEPCLDELEVYDTAGTNVALADSGTKARASSVFPNSDLHRLEHLNEGKYGNSHSWISNERGKGWVELEFPKELTITRVVWGRDREQKYSDRLALDYRIETALDTNHWSLVASSQDRVPYSGGRTSLVDVSVSSPSDPNGRAARDLLAQRAKLETRVKELTDFPMAYAGTMVESPEPVNRLQRGDPMQKRELIEPGTLTAVPVAFRLGAAGDDAQTNSSTSKPLRLNEEKTGAARSQGVPPSPPLEERAGERRPSKLTDDQQRRLSLALWIANPSNPLPARVMVNRIWQHHFGEGLVSTPSDFGNKGAKPSHAELLDWLASELRDGGSIPSTLDPRPSNPWSLKHIHRLIVTSAAYCQSSASRPKAIAVDAATRLLWRFPPQRLEAEQLRDAILAVSGKLELQSGGPGFSAFEPNDNYVRIYNPKKEFGPPEWRRMIYMTKVRLQQDSTFGAFDCPDGGQVTPKRMHSTTPLQALNLLNSNFIVQQSGFLAERLEKEAGKSPDAPACCAFEIVYSRSPDAQELKAARTFITANGTAVFCRALFNSNEFIFVE